MTFSITPATTSNVTDEELSHLLFQVYVQGGYTTETVANTVLSPALIRKRGYLFIAREQQNQDLAGMIIVVPSASKACVLAKQNEYEIHLLGVLAEYRNQGLGQKLVATAILHAQKLGASKVILWTQTSMLSAQKIYAYFGFVQRDNISKNDIEFFVYEKILPV